MIVPVPEEPGPRFDRGSSAIAVPATSVGLAMPSVNRLNWLLAARQGVVFQGSWPAAVTAISSRIYHRRSTNCDRILILALIEGSTYAPGATITVTPSNGLGTPVSLTVYDTTATTPFGRPGWQMWLRTADLTASGIQYHEVDWSNLKVRHLTVWELARDRLDTSSDSVVDWYSGAFAGFEAGRQITDASVAGVVELLSAAVSARDATKRHGGGIILPAASAWSTATAGSWANLAATAYAMSSPAFALQHRARQVRQATTSVPYEVRICGRYTGTGGKVRLRSGTTADTVVFDSLTGSWAWYAPDGAATLDVGAGSVDSLYPEGDAKASPGNTAAVTSVQFLE